MPSNWYCCLGGRAAVNASVWGGLRGPPFFIDDVSKASDLGSRGGLIAVRDRAAPACLKNVVELLAGGVSHRRSFRYSAHCLGSRNLL